MTVESAHEPGSPGLLEKGWVKWRLLQLCDETGTEIRRGASLSSSVTLADRSAGGRSPSTPREQRRAQLRAAGQGGVKVKGVRRRRPRPAANRPAGPRLHLQSLCESMPQLHGEGKTHPSGENGSENVPQQHRQHIQAYIKL